MTGTQTRHCPIIHSYIFPSGMVEAKLSDVKYCTSNASAAASGFSPSSIQIYHLLLRPSALLLLPPLQPPLISDVQLSSDYSPLETSWGDTSEFEYQPFVGEAELGPKIVSHQTRHTNRIPSLSMGDTETEKNSINTTRRIAIQSRPFHLLPFPSPPLTLG